MSGLLRLLHFGCIPLSAMFSHRSKPVCVLIGKLILKCAFKCICSGYGLIVNNCMWMTAPTWLWLLGRELWSSRLAGLNDFLWRPFVCPWIAWDNPGCPYHTEGISMPSRNKDKDCWQCFIREHLHLIMICQYNIVGGGAQLKPSIGCCFSLLCKL